MEGALDGVAVDANGTVWVYRGTEAEGHIEGFGDGEKNKFTEALEPEFICPKPGFAVAAGGDRFYLDYERANREEFCPLEEGEAARPVVTGVLGKADESLEALVSALDPENTTGAAVDFATEPSTSTTTARWRRSARRGLSSNVLAATSCTLGAGSGQRQIGRGLRRRYGSRPSRRLHTRTIGKADG